VIRRFGSGISAGVCYVSGGEAMPIPGDALEPFTVSRKRRMIAKPLVYRVSKPEKWLSLLREML
jgi:hypothetical protein